MKVVTVGRSSQNDITVNDPKVSRHHCQIVQYDDGSYGIVDFGSTNGTYVNGQKVHGEEGINPNDVVRIGYTTLPWRNYFGTVMPPSKKTNVLPIVLGVAGGVLAMAAMIVLLVLGKGFVKSGEIQYNGPEPLVCTVTLEENGASYDVDAVEGQVIVMFKEEVSHRKAVKILKKKQAKILAQMPDVQYYLVEVPAGKESEFFSYLRNLPGVDYVYPNAIEVTCSTTSHVIDNFYGNHGDMVVSMMKGCTPLIDVKQYDVENGDDQHINTYKADREFKKIISNLGETESAVINISFGPGLKPERERSLWDDAYITNDERANYIYALSSSLAHYVKKAKRFDDKDFVITYSSGNEGLKGLEVVFESLRYKLSSKEYAVFERHFILVSAKDDNREGDYPNDVKNYNKMVTKVDISDMTAQNLHWQGTSFASPRAASFIASVANSKDMKVTEVLKYARKATKHAPDHILTQELLEKTIEEENNKVTTENEYKKKGCLKYRLVKDNSTDMERLELRNICDEDIRVIGYFLNKIAPHGGDNTIEFETVVRAKGTEFVDGFMENECTITKVEKMGEALPPVPENSKWKSDYYKTIAYNQSLFDSKSKGSFQLSNGDVIYYRFDVDMDFVPTYSIIFYMNGADIRKKYKVGAVESLDSESGFIGDDDDYRKQINVTISMMGYLEMANNQIMIIIKNK